MKIRKGNIITVFFILLLVYIFNPNLALSHKVNIFAYIEGEKIFTESYFNDGSPCIDSLIHVYDPNGNELLNGKTDKDGLFSFTVPDKIDLKIVLTASLGHKNEYVMKASDMGSIITTNMTKSEEKSVKEISDETSKEVITQPFDIDSIDQVRKVVEETVERSLDKNLKPLIRQLAKIEASRMSLSDIIGGIGYIFGIMGIIFYFRKREERP